MLNNFYPSIDADYMRSCAISNNWFTCGNNEQYSKWLNMAGYGHKVTSAWLYKAAAMAVQYSDMEKLGYSGEDKERRRVIRSARSLARKALSECRFGQRTAFLR